MSAIQIGDRFGDRTVTALLGVDNGHRRYQLTCRCGKVSETTAIRNSVSCKSCARAAYALAKAEAWIGKEFGPLKVVSIIPPGGRGKVIRAQCICKRCGRETKRSLSSLIRKGAKKCGQCDTALTHGATVGRAKGRPRDAEYNTLCYMKTRCLNPKASDYEYYGGRGISIFPEWLGRGGYKKFLAHVGRKPSPDMTIDRYPDPNGNYEPGNVRWATRFEQTHNQRSRQRNLKTHCPQGHEYTPENTLIRKNGYRHCRACASTRSSADWKRRKDRIASGEIIPERVHLLTCTICGIQFESSRPSRPLTHGEPCRTIQTQKSRSFTIAGINQ